MKYTFESVVHFFWNGVNPCIRRTNFDSLNSLIPFLDSKKYLPSEIDRKHDAIIFECYEQIV